MSKSKKANRKVSPQKSKSAQRSTKKKSVRSARVASMPVEQPAASVAAIQSQPESSTKNTDLQTNILRVFTFLAVVGITIYIFSIRDRVQDFAAFGYPGIFLIALLANATILLPAPGLAIVYAMGAIFHPLGVGIAAGAGGALGELSGYLAGFSGQAVIERTDIYNRIKPWVDKYGGWAILIMSAIPNPFFDVAGIAAGIAKMPMPTFLLFTLGGQLIKMTTFAFAGKYSIEWISQLIN